MLKTLFLGTPVLAVPFLNKLHEKSKILSVITTPDQPAGRGYQVKAPPVKMAAQGLSLPVWQPERLKEAGIAERFEGFKADVGIVVAYGKLLPKPVLASTQHGFLNVHFSLLPKYRGAAPIQWTLVNGESETGVSLFWLDEGMDTGPVFIQKKISVVPGDDADALRNKLVELGVLALADALRQIEAGQIVRTPQGDGASLAPILKKDDGLIRWQKSASAIQNQLWGLTPWPGLFTKGFKVLKLKVLAEEAPVEPGVVSNLVSGEGPVVRCGQGSVVLLEVQPEGKKAMPAWSWWQGARLKIGDKLG